MSRVLAALLVLLTPSLAAAQPVYESVGARALGMAGAFVGVSDDATAVYWNPAGLASSRRPVGLTIGWDRLQTGNSDGPPTPGASRRESRFSGLGSWPLGVFYGRYQTSELTERPSGTVVSTLRTTQIGATILQSLVEGLVVAASLKYVRGFVASSSVVGLTAGGALDAGSDAEGRSTSAFDLDVGLMADMERVRVGVTVRNLRKPEFPGLAGSAMRLQRQGRLGVAVLPADGLTLALDVDLDTVDLRDGLRRMIALGGEHRLGARLVVRGGFRWNVAGDHRQPVGAAGASAALNQRWWLDTHVTRGRTGADRGFGVALRAGF
jgi:hypothetical protein